jgi:type III secretion system YscD/HrpQ family protein
MASDERFILKVLTGPNQGAELELSAGAYVIGSADECDVNFSDALVAPRHLSVELSEDSIVAKRLDGKVFVDGKPMVDTRQTIKFFQFVTAGSTYFLFGPAGREWPQGVPGPLPPLKPETETQPESAAPKPEPAESSALSTKGPEGPKDEASPTDRAKKVALLTFLLFGVLAVSSFLLMSLDRRDPPPPATAESILPGVKAMVQKQPYAEAVTVGIRNSRVFVSGFVRTSAEARQLRSLVTRPDGLVACAVVSDEEILADVGEILDSFRSGLSAKMDSAGGVEISGFAGDTDTWNQLRTLLESDLPGYPRLKFSVVSGNQVISEGEAILRQSGLTSLIRLEATSAGLTASGSVPPMEAEVWAQAKDKIQSELPAGVMLKDQVTSGGGSSSVDDYLLSSISMGPLPWVTLRNGKKLFPGAVLPNGWTLQTIQPESVELRQGDASITIDLGKNLLETP